VWAELFLARCEARRVEMSRFAVHLPFTPVAWALASLLGLGACGSSTPTWSVLAGERTTIGPSSGLGFGVRDGEVKTLVCDVPARSALRFFMAGASSGVAAAEEPVVRFGIHYEGEPLWEQERRLGEAWDHWIEVALPAASRSGARFEFRVSGEVPVARGFLCPTVGPLGAVSGAPDLIVFVVEGLELQEAGELVPLEAAPHLVRSASEGVTFLDARGSLAQCFQELDALARVLGPRGYRTALLFEGEPLAAVDGFEWSFQHGPSERGRLLLMKRGLEYLARSDGRPSALFVVARPPESARASPAEERRRLSSDMEEWRVLMQRDARSSPGVFAFLAPSGGEETLAGFLQAPELEPRVEARGLPLAELMGRLRSLVVVD